MRMMVYDSDGGGEYNDNDIDEDDNVANHHDNDSDSGNDHDDDDNNDDAGKMITSSSNVGNTLISKPSPKSPQVVYINPIVVLPISNVYETANCQHRWEINQE